ncbi:hypothetical protein AQUCO_03700222v1 [Aquilegia coerulea]|uniref:Uncharacterized protein n=1 Tax=Aquilegia coerulea TaxID=218851 RepID=A0A2G5CU49_AQUCA|nr:hypothetical protein AQUCO_03700222v1 [Aquilegia coerulea]
MEVQNVFSKSIDKSMWYWYGNKNFYFRNTLHESNNVWFHGIRHPRKLENGLLLFINSDSAYMILRPTLCLQLHTIVSETCFVTLEHSLC